MGQRNRLEAAGVSCTSCRGLAWMTVAVPEYLFPVSSSGQAVMPDLWELHFPSSKCAQGLLAGEGAIVKAPCYCVA